MVHIVNEDGARGTGIVCTSVRVREGRMVQETYLAFEDEAQTA